MSAPDFWQKSPPAPAARLLTPIGALYGARVLARMGKKGARLDIPVLCVGNFTLGGAGKTPVALALAEFLAGTGLCAQDTIAFVSRGYGAKAILRTPLRVDALRHGAHDVGEEALLLARCARTYVCRNRALAARAAHSEGAGLIILDDGLQNPSLSKTLTFAVIPAANPFGNGLCFPAGPLRAPLKGQMRMVDGIIQLSQPGETFTPLPADMAEAAHVPLFRARIETHAGDLARLQGKRVFAFAGLGHPQKFFDSLAAQGVDVAHTRAFPDHWLYAPEDYAALVQEAKMRGLVAVTTHKDYVKLASFDAEGFIMPIPVQARFLETDALKAHLAKALAGECGVA